MLWSEFENLIDVQCSWETYHNIVEPMYMALPEHISKQQFVAMLNPEYFRRLREDEIRQKMDDEAAADGVLIF